jgi:hypothetical protein
MAVLEDAGCAIIVETTVDAKPIRATFGRACQRL